MSRLDDSIAKLVLANAHRHARHAAYFARQGHLGEMLADAAQRLRDLGVRIAPQKPKQDRNGLYAFAFCFLRVEGTQTYGTVAVAPNRLLEAEVSFDEQSLGALDLRDKTDEEVEAWFSERLADAVDAFRQRIT